jgi:hypothetical protein
MRSAKMIAYLVGCAGVVVVGTALAKKPAPTVATALSTPAGCTDSLRGRTHILRFCGDAHYWIKRPVAGAQWGSLAGPIDTGFAGSFGGIPTISVNLNR